VYIVIYIYEIVFFIQVKLYINMNNIYVCVCRVCDRDHCTGTGTGDNTFYNMYKCIGPFPSSSSSPVVTSSLHPCSGRGVVAVGRPDTGHFFGLTRLYITLQMEMATTNIYIYTVSNAVYIILYTTHN